MEDLLVSSIICGDTEDLRQLLQSSGCCSRQLVNSVLRDGSTLLNVAIANRSLDSVRILIEYEADVELPDSFRVDGCRKKPIHYACASGDLDLVKLLVEEHGADVDEKDEGNSTPIHHASVFGHIEIVEYLVSAGCDIHHRSNSGKTVLWKAAAGGHRELVHLLYAFGVNINIRNQVGESILFECSRKVHLVNLVTDLVQFGADLSLRDVEKNSVLHLAAVVGNTAAAEVLFVSGAELNCVNEYGNTPLHNATMHGQTAFAVALLNYGAIAHALNFNRQSVLYVAMLHVQKDSCRLLRLAGIAFSDHDRDMFENYESNRNDKKRAFTQWLGALFNCPMDLSSTCRIIIRRHLAGIPLESVSKLPLPKALHHFLLLDDILSSLARADVGL